jgi:2-oxoglutarate ferredoxin oxidoreductase subunit gamma
MLIKILLSGDGGQGIQLVSDLLAQAAFDCDCQITQIPNYGLEQRGGVSISFLQISNSQIAYPRFTKPDILLIMSPQAEERTKQYQIAERILRVTDFEKVFKANNILPGSYNIFFLGVLAKILAEKKVLNKEKVFELLEKKLSKKLGWEENKRAFEMGTLQIL